MESNAFHWHWLEMKNKTLIFWHCSVQTLLPHLHVVIWIWISPLQMSHKNWSGLLLLQRTCPSANGYASFIYYGVRSCVCDHMSDYYCFSINLSNVVLLLQPIWLFWGSVSQNTIFLFFLLIFFIRYSS